MNLSQFIDNKEVYYTENLIDAITLANIEKKLGISFGKQLSQYILQYGYLAYKYIELYGINSKQMEESDMVIQTEYIHKYFPKTANLVVVENTGDANYIVVSSDDEVYEYNSEDDSIKKLGLVLFDYIVNRFQEAEE